MEKTVKYYNQEIKERFINSYKNDESRVAVSNMMKKAAKTENVYNKDLYDMTLNEIDDVVSSLASSSQNAAYNKLLRIERYVDWAIKNGYRKSNINLLNSISGKREYAIKFVADRKNDFFTKDEIIDMMDSLVNDVDKAIFLGLFEGINGREFSELLNLKISDITIEGSQGWAKLTNETLINGEIIVVDRKIPISDLLADTLKRAQEQTEYLNKNGDAEGDDRHRTSDIETSEFIINKMKRGVHGGRPNKSVMNRKFKEFKNVFGYRFLKADHIKKSGIMNMAHDLQENEVLTEENLNKIAAHYDTWNKDMNIGQKRQSRTRIADVIITKEFEELYEYKLKLVK